MTRYDNSGSGVVLSALDPEQRVAAAAPLGPVRILAGAGTGKTRTVTHRIAHHIHEGNVTPREVLAVTHSRKAASEMRERLHGLGVGGVAARTFHSAALKQLWHFWDRCSGGAERPDLLTQTAPFVRQALGALRQVPNSAVSTEHVRDVVAEIVWAHARMLSPRNYEEEATRRNREVTGMTLRDVGAAYGAYEQLKLTRNRMDFDDVLMRMATLLHENGAVAREVQDAYSFFIVDEYQDTDLVQQHLLDGWLGSRNNITVVGDTSQTIYSFKGAEPDLLLKFADRHPKAVSVELVRSYRSSAQVVAAANRLAKPLRGSVTLQAVSNTEGPAPRVRDYETDADEVAGIIAEIQRLTRSGVSHSEIAILHRFNSQAPAIRTALAEAGVPVTVRPEDKFFTTDEVRRVAWDLGDAARRAPHLPALDVVRDSLATVGFNLDNPPQGVGRARERWENQAALLDMVNAIAAATAGTSAEVFEELGARSRAEHVPTGVRGVTVSTIHKAKGLEWDVVFVARTTEGSLPATVGSGPLIEERRLAYVAASRARRQLWFTWSKTWGSFKAKSKPSTFHDDIQVKEPTSRRRAA